MAHSHVVRDMDKHFIIDPIARTVTNAESKKTLLMQNDHNSERFSFEIDKLVEGHDMTLCNKVEIHYTNFDSNKKNMNPGVYEVADVKVSPDDPNKLIFTWLVSQNATMYNGTLQFMITFACVENGDVTYRWNSGVNNTIVIAKGLNNGEVVEETYPDILTQWKNELFAAVFGMETVHVGPIEPVSYPYIWFDTSAYVGTDDENVGVLTIKDSMGNKQVLYPTTILAGTDHADMGEAIDNHEERISANAESISGLSEALSATNESVTSLGNSVDEAISDLSNSVDQSLETLANSTNESLTTKQNNLVETTKSLAYNGWSNYTQTISVDGILASHAGVIVTPRPDNHELWCKHMVRAESVTDGQITFACRTMPSNTIYLNIVYWE